MNPHTCSHCLHRSEPLPLLMAAAPEAQEPNSKLRPQAYFASASKPQEHVDKCHSQVTFASTSQPQKFERPLRQLFSGGWNSKQTY